MPQEMYLKTAGEFEAVVAKPQSGWLGQSKEKGTPYVHLQLIVTDDDEDGKTIPWYGYLSDKAIERTIETLVACFNFDGDLTSLYAEAQTFEGMKVNIVVEEESYEGKARFKVKWMNPAGYVHAAQSLAPETAKMLIAGLGNKTKAAALDAKSRLGRPKEVAAPKIADMEDDVPF